MRAQLGYAAFVEHDQPVHRGDGRKPVGNRDHRLALHQRVEALLDRGLDFQIERRGRLVKDEDRRVLQQHARDGDALALSARQLDAALANMGLIAPASVWIGQAEHEFMGMCPPRRRDDRLHRRAGPPIADILGHGAVQERGILRHHADLTAQTVLSDRRDVLPIDQVLPLSTS